MTTQIAVNKCDGYSCSPPKECCQRGCCLQFMQPSNYRPSSAQSGNVFNNPLFLGHWYFWLAVTATVAGILCACSLWRKHSQGGLCCKSNTAEDRACSEPDSNGSCYAPPQYSRCNSFHQPPPPYSEVASKPDLYPLVISYNHPEPIIKNNNTSTGYLMVQYFRNFIGRPVGSISATSTNDSLSSSFLCNAANEANTIIPPPYSNVASLEELANDTRPQASPATSERRIPRSTSSISSATTEYQQVLQRSPSAHTQLEAPAQSPSNSSRPKTPSRSSQQSLVQIRNNPCFIDGRSSAAPPAVHNSSNTGSQSLKTDKSKEKHQTTAGHPVSKTARVPKTQESTEDDEQHNFSDLLNLSVCVPQAEHSAVHSAPLLQDMHFSITNSMTGSDISSLANLGTPDSPPRATSPTVEMRELLDKIQQLPQHKSPIPPGVHHASQARNYFHKIRAKTLYMPLGETSQVSSAKTKAIPNVFSRAWLSRSAPCTPCGNFVPNFPIARSSQKGSKTRITDGSPLLKQHAEESEDEPNRDECL